MEHDLFHYARLVTERAIIRAKSSSCRIPDLLFFMLFVLAAEILDLALDPIDLML